jgi:hypothetical protein
VARQSSGWREGARGEDQPPPFLKLIEQIPDQFGQRSPSASAAGQRPEVEFGIQPVMSTK